MPVRATNVPATMPTAGTDVARAVDREAMTVGDALAMLGGTLQQMQGDDLSVELDAEPGRVRLRVRCYKHRRNSGGDGA